MPDTLSAYDAFGHWLSGMTAGEGCFGLRTGSRTLSGKTYRLPSATYSIALRADDRPILRTIQAFLQCGVLKRRRYLVHPSKPQVLYQVCAVADLWNIVVPQFERYPLLAKKANDFTVWRVGVKLLYEIRNRPWHSKNWRGTKRSEGGFLPKWTEEELNHFAALVTALDAGRGYIEL